LEDLDIAGKIILQLSERNKMEMLELYSSCSEWRWFAVVNGVCKPLRFIRRLQLDSISSSRKAVFYGVSK
jgi:hypothetical protein